MPTTRSGVASVPTFPFSAVVGQDDAKLALLLNALDHRIGGVVLRGEKGSAKSTLARGLAALLPGTAPFVDLPVSATEDRVVGSLDLESALTAGQRRFHPGLLAEADNGVLYIDEVNLLPDHLVDVLLDVAASGVNRVQRESVAEEHLSRFVLIGSMNPEEGELRPQLLDRFGLAVDVTSSRDPADRVQAVRRRMVFDEDPDTFAATWAPADAALAEQLAGATPASVSDALMDQISALCVAVGCEGLRADLVICRGAAALAGWEGRAEATVADVRRVAPLALAHRRRRSPFDEPGINQGEIDDALDTPPGTPSAGGAPDVPDASASPEPVPRDQEGGGPPDAPADRRGGGHRGAAAADAPTRVVPFSGPRAALADAASGRRTMMESSRGRMIGSRVPDGAVRDVAVGATLQAAAVRTAVGVVGVAGAGGAGGAGGAAGAAGAAGAGVAQPARVAEPRPAPGAQLAHAAGSRAAVVQPADLRQAVREARAGNLLVLAVDASASMGVERRMEAVKGAVLSLLLDAYQRRDRVALVTFGGEEATVVLRPTGSMEIARSRLADLPTGGRTPLAAGIDTALAVATAATAGTTGHQPYLVLVSDGRATAAPDGQDPLGAALAAAERVRRLGVPALVLDVEDGPTRLGLAAQLAEAMGGRHLPLPELSAGALATAIKAGVTP